MADDVFGIVGSVLSGTFQVEAVVAEGGFGVVYKAFHVGFRAPVALKCLKVPEQLAERQQQIFLEQFRREGELLFRLSASIPTVVRALHVDAFNTRADRFVPFIALEWLEGKTLDAIVLERAAEQRRPLTLKRLVRMMTPVARALDRAHHFSGAAGPVVILHRDLKPENIFVAEIDGEEIVKILDFGIATAKSVASRAAGRESEGDEQLAAFTPAYGAPEQWQPKRFGQAGPWTDVWGLALTMVEVLAAHRVIDGDQAAMMGRALDPVRRPTPRNEGVAVSDEIENVFACAVALEPRDRYPDVGAFWDELCGALGPDFEKRSTSRAPVRDRRSEGPGVPRIERIELHAAEPQILAMPELAIPDLELGAIVRTSVVVQPRAATAPAPAPARLMNADFEPDAAGDDPGLSIELESEQPVRGQPQPAASRSAPLPVARSLPATGGSSALERAREIASRLPATRLPERAIRGDLTLIQRLWPGSALLVASIVVSFADQSYAASSGYSLTVGPIRATWIAAALVVSGLALLIYRFLPRDG